MSNKRFIALVFLIPTAICAQQSAYQDTDGHTSIYFLDGKGNLTFNVSDTKFSIGLVHMPDGNSEPGDDFKDLCSAKCIYGINFSGKPTTDLANQLFQTSSSPATVEGGGVFGFHGVLRPRVDSEPANTPKIAGNFKASEHHFEDDWLLFNVNYTKSTFDTVATGSSTPVVQHFNGFSFMPTWNLALQGPGFNYLLGFSAGVSETNNVSNLKKVSIDTTESSNGTTSIVKSQDAYLGSYATSVNVPIYSDFVFIPKHLEWISFDAFERSNVLRATRFAEGGIGLFVAQPQQATKVLGGLSIGWKDGARTIAIVGGWTF